MIPLSTERFSSNSKLSCPVDDSTSASTQPTSTRILCLHGFTGSPRAYDAMTAALCARRPQAVLTPALVGHDVDVPSAVQMRVSPQHDHTAFRVEVDRIAALIRTDSCQNIHLVGYSMGARVALGLLVHHRTLVARATLIGVHPGLATSQQRRARIASDQYWLNLLTTEPIEAFVNAWQALPMWTSQTTLAAEVQAAQRALRLQHRPMGLASALSILGLGHMPNYRAKLTCITAPIQLITGERDDKFCALAKEMCAQLPNARHEIVSDVGHNVLLERPDHVAHLIESFTAQTVANTTAPANAPSLRPGVAK